MFGELLGLLFGQIAAESTRDPEKRGSTFLDANTDALSGATSAVLGSIGLLLGICSTLMAFRVDTTAALVAVFIIAVVAFGSSYFGAYFGRRAPHVTRRCLGMARYAVIISAAGVVVSAVSPVVAVVMIVL